MKISKLVVGNRTIPRPNTLSSKTLATIINNELKKKTVKAYKIILNDAAKNCSSVYELRHMDYSHKYY